MIATSSSSDVRMINAKILTYLIMKLCYNGNSTSLVRSCDIMDESFINSTDTPTCVEQISCGMYNHLNYVSGFANRVLVCIISNKIITNTLSTINQYKVFRECIELHFSNDLRVVIQDHSVDLLFNK